jgi:DNA-binding NarL/FixJ family response regulator
VLKTASKERSEMTTESNHTSSLQADGLPGKRISVLLVDDHPAIRMGAGRLIDDQPDMRVLAEARSAEEALGLGDRVDVAVVDYQLGHGHDGLWLTAQLGRAPTRPHVLVYSAFADGSLGALAVIAGADGLLGKHELGEELCRAIRRLARGEHHLPAINASVANTLRSRLDPRDQAIFGMLLHGIAPEVIADRLRITHDELHVRRSVILASLKRRRGACAISSGTQAPLDYERPRARPRGWSRPLARSRSGVP